MSVYRDGGDRARPTRMLLCAECAAAAQVDADRDTWRCSACAAEQPLARVELTRYTRAGALGARWSSRDARLDLGGGAVLIEK